MATLDNYTDPARRDHGIDRLRYLPSHSLLDLKPAGVHVDQAGQLAQTHDPAFGDVADVHAPKERKQMVLTQTVENDVLHDDHIVVTGEGEEGIAYYGGWIGGVALR
jgi:hypothetical protein